MITFISWTNAHGVKITTAVEQVRTTKTADGRTVRLIYGRWHTKFGGWTSEPQWQLVSSH